MKNSTSQWLEAAEDDLSVIESIISNESLSHIVAFHAQQAIEKCLKAVCEEFNMEIPRIHKLDFLYALTCKYIKIYIDIQILKDLDTLYIDSRYPGNIGLMPYGKPSTKDTRLYWMTAVELVNHLKEEFI